MPSSTRPGFRLSSLALGAVIISVLAALAATDRMMTQASRERTRLDAAESAMLVESFLVQRADALMALRTLYSQPAAARHQTALADYVVSLADFLPGIRRIWVADSAGVVIDDIATDGNARLPRFDMDTLGALGIDQMLARVRAAWRPTLSRPGIFPGDERGVVMLVPLCPRVQPNCHGFVAALLSTDALLESAMRRPHPGQSRLVILVGGDTVAATPVSTQRTVNRATALVPTPDGRRWTVVTEHLVTGRAGRILLWTLGLTALAGLTAGMVRTRREAARASDRSRELERLSTELLRANRSKSEFLANVSHELRTPLNAIVGFVDLLRDGVYGELGPRQVAPVERIAVSATHLRHLVDQVLDIAKMAAGRLEVHHESVDLRPFVLDVATEVEPLISEKDLSISISVPATLPRVRTDPAHLRQILMNLIGNAVKYTNAGSIGVRGRFLDASVPDGVPSRSHAELRSLVPDPSKPWIALQVADTGIGVAPTDHARVFEEFEQVNAGPRGESMQRGTGLGLAISRRLARLLGGEISLQSELGKGATFTLWLPVHPADIRVGEHRLTTPSGSRVITPEPRR